MNTTFNFSSAARADIKSAANMLGRRELERVLGAKVKATFLERVPAASADTFVDAPVASGGAVAWAAFK
jgi:hypothetical protein